MNREKKGLRFSLDSQNSFRVYSDNFLVRSERLLFYFFFTSTFMLELVELVSTIVVVVGGIILVVSVGAEVFLFLTTCELQSETVLLISSSSCTHLHISHKFSSPFFLHSRPQLFSLIDS